MVLTVYKDSNGLLWIGTYGNGFDIFNPKTNTFKHFENQENNKFSLSNNIVWAFNEVNKNEMWIATRGGGLNIYNAKTQKFSHCLKNEKIPYSISDNKVLCVYKDNAGVIWVGTETQGLNKLNLRMSYFEVISQSTYPELSQNNIMAILEDTDNSIWLGTRGGGIYIVSEDKTIREFFKDYSIQKGYSNILSMTFDGKYVWSGTDGNGFRKINKKTGNVEERFVFDATNKNSLSNNAVTSLLIDSDSVLWIGTYGGGLNKFDIKKRKFRNFPIESTSFMRNVVWTIFEDSKGLLWIGTGGKGLMRLDRSTERYVFFENTYNDKESISNNIVLSVNEASDGFLWVGTGGGGLNKFDRKNGTFKNYSLNDGLPNDMILGIIEDNDKFLWMSTYNGLSRFNPRNEEFLNFSESDGISGVVFNERSFQKRSNGEILFGGVNGITRFFPDSIKRSKYNPTVVLTALKIYNRTIGINEQVNGKTILTKSITETEHLEISYQMNMFSIEFSSLHFLDPKSNLYKYKLIGFDEDWNYTDASKRFATYTNLNGGDYVFMVVGSNSDGIWNETATKLHIKVLPPFWKEAWFYTLLVVIILLMISLFIKFRERQLINDKRKLEEMVDERTIEINQQKEELQSQSELLAKNNEDLSRTNRLVKDSISYAKRIQDAMLPSLNLIKSLLPDSFVFFKPKDIVSGDFYWCYVKNDKIYLATADCTGHGVPGAFMSMIGNTLLNEIISNNKIHTPSEILKKLNTGVILALKQKNDGATNSQDDGMDITICCIDKANGILEIACANQTVFMIQNNEMLVIEGDICTIGGIFSADDDKIYSNNTFKITPGMKIFMFSDGFQDQFGGLKNKKYLASKFKELINKNKDISMNQFSDLLESEFENWRGGNKQVDDVLVLGFTV
ncbi:MAG: SpoIIE family protein phosphatase [Bacteroidales bacterium]|nr:SpoIIE family protein phosphatase [Bacteroidales bacterium]